MLAMRRRGKNGTYSIRGSVALGDQCIKVPEFSSGTNDADAASHLMAEYETKLRNQLMFGPAATVSQGCLVDAFDSYLSKPKPPCPSDVLRIGKLNGLIGDLSLREPRQAWEQFRRAYLLGHDPAGQDRYRAVFQAAVNVHHELHNVSVIKIKALPFDNERVRWLTKNRSRSPDRVLRTARSTDPNAAGLPWPADPDGAADSVGRDGIDMARQAIRLNHTKKFRHRVRAHALACSHAIGTDLYA